MKRVTSTGNFFGFVVDRDFLTPNLDNVSEDNLFKGNRSTENVHHGFTLNGANDNRFKANEVSNNGTNGILIIWEDNVFNTANPTTCIQ